MHEGHHNRPVNAFQLAENREISRKHCVLGQTFGSVKRWFGFGSAQLKGLRKVHAEHIMEAIAHYLKRLPRIAASTGQNQQIQGGLCIPEKLLKAAVTVESRLKSSQKSRLHFEVFCFEI